MKKIILNSLFSLSSLVFSVNTSAMSLTDLKGMEFDSKKNSSDSIIEGKEDLRNAAMRDAALAIGAQWGYKKYMNVLKSNIKEQSDSLDALYDFNTLMKLTSDGYNELYLLPPVIRETRDAISLSLDAKERKSSKIVWERIRDEQLVINPPNWRQYILFDRDVEIPKIPNVLLPKSQLEKEKWKSWVTTGWKSGISQADREMERRINKLGIDFNGMLKYKRLNIDNKITSPIVTSSYVEVKGDDNKMYEHDRLLKLTVPSKFNRNAEEWKAYIHDNRDSYRAPLENK